MKTFAYVIFSIFVILYIDSKIETNSERIEREKTDSILKVANSILNKPDSLRPDWEGELIRLNNKY